MVNSETLKLINVPVSIAIILLSVKLILVMTGALVVFILHLNS